MDEAVARRESRDLWIGVAATAIALAAMAVDHLIGNEPDSDDEFPVDPVGFFVTAALCVAAAVFMFGLVVPRARRRGPEYAANLALGCSVVSFVAGIVTIWLGVPFVVAGAGIALGLHGLAGHHRYRAIAALVFGGAVIALGSLGYAVVAVDRLA